MKMKMKRMRILTLTLMSDDDDDEDIQERGMLNKKVEAAVKEKSSAAA